MPSQREGQNDKEDENLNSLQNEHGKPNTPDGVTAGSREKVKPSRDSQRVEPSAALSKGTPNGEGEKVWERIWERQNLLTALTRVETNGGAPGIDGMTVEELRPYLCETFGLKGHWLDIRSRLDGGTYQPSPVRRVEIPKPDGGMRLLGIPIRRSHCTSYQ